MKKVLMACMLIGASVQAYGAESAPDPREKTLEAVHTKLEHQFASTPGNGISRIAEIRVHQPRNLPLFTFSFGTERWKIDNFEFIGMFTPTPKVYAAGESKLEKYRALLKTKNNDYDTRPADLFETRSLPLLQKDAVVAEISDREIRMVGALHATKGCLACHANREELRRTGEKLSVVSVPVKEGDVLGAFSYRISRGADVDDVKARK